MAQIENVEITSLLFDEQASAPTTPATGFWRPYFKSDGMYVVDDAGTETGPLGTGGGGGSSAAVGAKITRTSSQSIATATWTEIDFDASVFDTDTLASLASNSITAHAAGVWDIAAEALHASASATGTRYLRILKNGTQHGPAYRVIGSTAAQPYVRRSEVMLLALNDVITAEVYQDAGSSQTITFAHLSAVYHGTT